MLKVHLQLRGFTVFLDIEKLAAGKFDDKLLNSIKQAKHFILVLTRGALERCMNDDLNKDWVHRVCISEFEKVKNSRVAFLLISKVDNSFVNAMAMTK